MTETKAATIMKQVCEAVNEIHSLKIIHRDIKPENIVLHDVNIFLIRMLSSYATLAGQSIRTTDSVQLSAELLSTFVPRSLKERSTTKR